MRIIIFIAVIGFIGWHGYNALTTQKSPLGGLVKAKMESTDGAQFLHPWKKDDPKNPANKLASAEAEKPAPVDPAAAVPATPAPVPPVGAGLAPVIVFGAGSYRFNNCEPPPDTEFAAYSQAGISVVVNRASRSVFYRGPVDTLGAFADFLVSLDVMGGGCSVRTWAVFVDDNVTKGWDLTAAINAAAGLETSLGIGGGSAVLNLGLGDLTAALSIIGDGGSVRVLQRPHLALSHGVESVVESTREVPTPSVTLSNGFSQQSVTYRKVGLQLHVTPYFLGGDRVRLKVDQQNGLVGPMMEVSGVSVPTVETQAVQTSVELGIGQTVILGGVATDRIETVKGLLRDTEQRHRGSLYVVLSTYYDHPKAVPVDMLEFPQPVDGVPVPFSTPSDDPGQWVLDELLPAKGWEKQEREFIRARGAK